MTKSYWVDWTCEGNQFSRRYDTSSERDTRVTELMFDDLVSDIDAWDDDSGA